MPLHVHALDELLEDSSAWVVVVGLGVIVGDRVDEAFKDLPLIVTLSMVAVSTAEVPMLSGNDAAVAPLSKTKVLIHLGKIGFKCNESFVQAAVDSSMDPEDFIVIVDAKSGTSKIQSNITEELTEFLYKQTPFLSSHHELPISAPA